MDLISFIISANQYSVKYRFSSILNQKKKKIAKVEIHFCYFYINGAKILKSLIM